MRAPSRSAWAAFGVILTSALLTGCAHSNTKPTPTTADKTAPAAGTAPFSVQGGGTVPLSYQWRFNGTNLSNDTNAPTATNR